MIKENYLEKLLDGADVEWKQLKEITKVLRGKRLTRKNLSDGEKFPVFHGGLEPLGFYSESNRLADTVMIINVGASAGTVGYCDEEFWSSDGCYCIEHTEDINNKYLYYFLVGQQHLLRSRVRYAGIPTLDAVVINKIPIPIPFPNNPEKSLEIQKEIVRILDTYTELIAELTAELTARKKQYNYYRDKLLTFEEDEVEWKMMALADIGQVIRGNGLQKKDFIEEGHPAIHYGQIYTKYGLQANETFTFVSEKLAKKLKIAKKNDLLIATTSENDEDLLKPIAWLGEKTAISGDMMLFNHKQNVKYLAYCFQTYNFQKQKSKYITGAKVRRISKDNLGKFLVPIPYPNNPEKSLAEQKRIVSILDKFEALTTSITEGLPREIELRQKQYEYYRNLLFSFPKDDVEV